MNESTCATLPAANRPEPNDADALDRVLESVLSAYRLRVEITANVRYCGNWREQEPATRYGQFHLLTEGECWVSGPGLRCPQQLVRGDLIVFPSGARHLLSATSDTRAPMQPPDATTSMLCGELEFTMGRNR